MLNASCYFNYKIAVVCTTDPVAHLPPSRAPGQVPLLLVTKTVRVATGGSGDPALFPTATGLLITMAVAVPNFESATATEILTAVDVTIVPTRGIKSDTTGDQGSDNKGHVALLTQRHAREYCLSHKSNETSLGGRAPVKREQGCMLRSTGIDAESSLVIRVDRVQFRN